MTKVICFRGLMGRPFSMGLDKLAEGKHNWEVYPYTSWKAVSQVRNTDDRYVLIGHSLGARAAIKASKVMRERGVKVDLVVCLDYVCNIFGFNDLSADKQIPTYHYRSKDLRTRTLKNAWEIPMKHLSHIQIDDNQQVHEGILQLIKQRSL